MHDSIEGSKYYSYERKVPERFSDLNNDDRLMQSMIQNYAMEETDDKGMPNGKFFLDQEQARRASEEVVSTHLNLFGQELKNYVDGNFYDVWSQMDAAGDGKIEAERMPTFFRMLCHDSALNI